MKKIEKTTTKCIVFLHPDLRLGGAERLIVDAAIAMKSKVLDEFFFFRKRSRERRFRK